MSKSIIKFLLKVYILIIFFVVFHLPINYQTIKAA